MASGIGTKGQVGSGGGGGCGVAAAAGRSDIGPQFGEIVSVWNGSVFGVRHYDVAPGSRPEAFRVGERPDCDLWMPLEALGGRDSVPVARSIGGAFVVTVLPGAVGSLLLRTGESVGLDDLVRSGRATPGAGVAGGWDVPLQAGERLRQDLGGFTFLAGVVARPKLVLGRPVKWTAPVFALASLVLHAAFLGVAWQYRASAGGLAVDVLDTGDAWQQMMVVAPLERKVSEEIAIEEASEGAKQEPDPAAAADDPWESGDRGGGARAAGDGGRAGRRGAPDVPRMAAVRGPKENPSPHLAKAALLESLPEYGAVSALRAVRDGAPTSIFSPYTAAMGRDPVDARGHLLGSEFGDAYGIDALGMFGDGSGGGGSNVPGTGLGDVGRMGRGYDGGDGSGIGIGRPDSSGDRARRGERSGPALRDHVAQEPGTVEIGNVRTYGGLAKEVVRRLVQQHRGRIRHCYEVALRAAPEVEGRVTVTFTIGPQGNVAGASADDATDDPALAACIVGVVRNMTFPAADGVTACSYPFLLRQVGSPGGI